MIYDPQAPRISPLDTADAPEAAQEILRNWPYNLHRVLARNVPTLKQWMPFAEHILRNNSVPAREREIAILRVAWNAQCAYEWGLHARLARSLGFGDDDLRNIALGGQHNPFWQPHEAALLDAVDDIMKGWSIGDSAWHVLAAHFDSPQLIDLVFVISQFMLVAVTLNSFRVPLEPGIEPLPVLAAHPEQRSAARSDRGATIDRQINSGDER
ncbi:MAG: carboxymuconolactone decarboxylase family protein [Gammaproteobacteria bacterium]